MRPQDPFLDGQRGAVMLQQDNARPHVARAVTYFVRQQNVNTLPWPAVSPDLSPIDHLWTKCRDAYVSCQTSRWPWTNWVVPLFRLGTTSHKGFWTIWCHQRDVVVRRVCTTRWPVCTTRWPYTVLTLWTHFRRHPSSWPQPILVFISRDWYWLWIANK